MATQWQVAPAGRVVQVTGKDLIRRAIGRSADRLDAAVMALVRSVGQVGWVVTTSEVFT